MLTVKWTKTALLDVDDAIEYICRDNINGAIGVAEKIHKACKLLQEMPFLGREGRFLGVREWVISGIPYTLWYQVNEETQILEVIRVLHHSRKQPKAQ